MYSRQFLTIAKVQKIQPTKHTFDQKIPHIESLQRLPSSWDPYLHQLPPDFMKTRLSKTLTGPTQAITD